MMAYLFTHNSVKHLYQSKSDQISCYSGLIKNKNRLCKNNSQKIHVNVANVSYLTTDKENHDFLSVMMYNIWM